VGYTVWGPFSHDSKYFEPSTKPFMFNFRVADLETLLEQLRKEGVQVDDRVEEYEFGRFGWIMDPEGHRIELWEPPEAMSSRS
jgi:predicted enzyme related to lactoylglutathione lyase